MPISPLMPIPVNIPINIPNIPNLSSNHHNLSRVPIKVHPHQNKKLNKIKMKRK